MAFSKRSRHDRKRRREEAEERAAVRAERSNTQQLQTLESRGFGSCQEAEKLRTKIKKEQKK